jgi:RNA polymerase sigma factor (sigma-70 family)
MVESDRVEPEAEPESGSTQAFARRVRGGDAYALAALYGRLTPAIHAYASWRLGERWISPEDIVADVWFRVAQKITDFDPGRSFRGWVFGFVTRVVREAQGRLARGDATLTPPGARFPDDLPDSITTPSRQASKNEELHRFIRWARDELSEYQREVLILRGVQGRSLAEVALTIGRTERAVTVCWSRLLTKLRGRSAPPDVLEESAVMEPAS